MSEAVNWLGICKTIRGAADQLEDEMSGLDPKSRRHAECTLAWHHLVDAHKLLSGATVTPDDLMWANGQIEEIVGRGR